MSLKEFEPTISAQKHKSILILIFYIPQTSKGEFKISHLGNTNVIMVIVSNKLNFIQVHFSSNRQKIFIYLFLNKEVHIIESSKGIKVVQYKQELIKKIQFRRGLCDNEIKPIKGLQYSKKQFPLPFQVMLLISQAEQKICNH